jgi:hypothetical protein
MCSRQPFHDVIWSPRDCSMISGVQPPLHHFTVCSLRAKWRRIYTHSQLRRRMAAACTGDVRNRRGTCTCVWTTMYPSPMHAASTKLGKLPTARGRTEERPTKRRRFSASGCDACLSNLKLTLAGIHHRRHSQWTGSASSSREPCTPEAFGVTNGYPVNGSDDSGQIVQRPVPVSSAAPVVTIRNQVQEHRRSLCRPSTLTE